MWRLVLLLTGCNAVFGIHDTRQLDAAYFDAPTDAPFACPALGAAAPTFSSTLHQDFVQDCTVYRVRGSVVVATCTDPMTQYPVNLTGALHQPLDAEHGLPQTDYFAQQYYDQLRLDADANLYLRHGGAGVYTVEQWTRGSDGTWAFAQTIPTPNAGAYPTVYEAFAGRVIVNSADYLTYDEQTLDGTTMFKHTPAEMGLQSFTVFSITGDGLHAIVLGQEPMATRSGLYYSDRATLDVAFSTGRHITTVPVVSELSYADDCSRVYFPALGSILYVQQD